MFESEILYNKVAQSFNVVLTDKAGRTEVSGGWKSRGEVHSQELEFTRNNVRLLKMEFNVNGHIPSITGKLTTQERVDLLLFAGVEDESDARLKFSHSSKGAETDDLQLSVSLHGGNALSNTVMWRRGALSDVHTFMRGLAAGLDKLDSAAFPDEAGDTSPQPAGSSLQTTRTHWSSERRLWPRTGRPVQTLSWD